MCGFPPASALARRDDLVPRNSTVIVRVEPLKKGCRQQRDLARIERATSPVLISQTKADVADTEFVKVAVGPAHRRLQHLVKTMELDAERHHDAPHHRRFNVVKGDLQSDQGGRHL